jgi:DivIVA domain-containing protein
VNPQNVRNAEFKIVRKGLDPDEVSQFLVEVADSLEKAQNHATAMEARARAAVQRAQDLAAAQPESGTDATDGSPVSVPDEAETISRALLLAQRTADTAIAEAEAEAEAVRASAAEEATRELDAARELATQMAEAAKADAEKLFADEKEAIAVEIVEMKENRDLLAADAGALDSFLAAQRERIRDAASTLVDLTERVPGGLAEMAAPVLDSRARDDTAELPARSDDVTEDDTAGEPDAAAVDEPDGDATPDDPLAGSASDDPDDEVVDAEQEPPSEPEVPAADPTQVPEVIDVADETATDDPADTNTAGSPDDLFTDLEEQSREAPGGSGRSNDDVRFDFSEEG